jgi:HEPN domain-containing protein
MTEEVKKLLEKAEHALEVAEELLKNGYPSDSASNLILSLSLTQ